MFYIIKSLKQTLSHVKTGNIHWARSTVPFFDL